jgi:hypothetical protein
LGKRFSSYFECSLALFPRRTGERFQTQFMPATPGEAFQEANPIPQTFSTLEALVDWHTSLFEAELRTLKKQAVCRRSADLANRRPIMRLTRKR